MLSHRYRFLPTPIHHSHSAIGTQLLQLHCAILHLLRMEHREGHSRTCRSLSTPRRTAFSSMLMELMELFEKPLTRPLSISIRTHNKKVAV